MAAILWLGLALLVLWVVLAATKVVVGGLLWLVLVAGAVLFLVGAVSHLGRHRTV